MFRSTGMGIVLGVLGWSVARVLRDGGRGRGQWMDGWSALRGGAPYRWRIWRSEASGSGGGGGVLLPFVAGSGEGKRGKKKATVGRPTGLSGEAGLLTLAHDNTLVGLGLGWGHGLLDSIRRHHAAWTHLISTAKFSKKKKN